MSVVVRRAFALMLLAGAVGASLALPAIFHGAQQATSGTLPVSGNATTTHVFASLPAPKAARPRSVVTVSHVGPAARRPVVRRAVPVIRTRAPVVPAPPVAPATPATTPAPPVVTTAAAPTPVPPASTDSAAGTTDKVIASTLATTTPPGKSGSGGPGKQKNQDKPDQGKGQGNDKATQGNGPGAAPGNGNGNGGAKHDNGHGKGH